MSFEEILRGFAAPAERYSQPMPLNEEAQVLLAAFTQQLDESMAEIMRLKIAIAKVERTKAAHGAAWRAALTTAMPEMGDHYQVNPNDATYQNVFYPSDPGYETADGKEFEREATYLSPHMEALLAELIAVEEGAKADHEAREATKQ